jgi:hypothetical protein
MQGLDLNLFFFREKFRSFDDFEQMLGFWSMFWFKSFGKFCRKIAIFCTFDHWSEILSMSAGRPISQGVCPPLDGTKYIVMYNIPRVPQCMSHVGIGTPPPPLPPLHAKRPSLSHRGKLVLLSSMIQSPTNIHRRLAWHAM